MSVYDRGTGVDIQNAIASLVDSIKDYDKDTHLEKSTDLNPELIGLLTQVQIKHKLTKDIFGVDTHMNTIVADSLMRKYISKQRKGREERTQILTGLLDKAMHPNRMINNLFGGGSE